ncbi:MAG: Hsp70 family protein, partial [Oscillospiraceae bacterium]|nr:Hsp70 family protein [Oscillospiraceae bacterium]
FYTVAGSQKQVSIRVLESLCSSQTASPDEGTEIGEAILELPEGLSAGSPLEIEFALSEGGLLELRAVEKTMGREVMARFETADAISGRELNLAKQRVEDSMIL